MTIPEGSSVLLAKQDSVFLGSDPASAVYLGDDLVWRQFWVLVETLGGTFGVRDWISGYISDQGSNPTDKELDFGFDFSNVNTAGYAFFSLSRLERIHIRGTSSVTSMSYMFGDCRSLTEVFEFDTSSVTTMSSMFRYCRSLTEVPEFDTSSVTTMSYMFDDCRSLTEVPEFDTSSVKTMTSMFRNCSSLESVILNGLKVSVDLSDTNMGAAALDALFESLGTAKDSNQNVIITGTPGAATCNKSIATNKGWTVIG